MEIDRDAPAPGGAQPREERARGASQGGALTRRRTPASGRQPSRSSVTRHRPRHQRRRWAGGSSSSSSPPSRRARASGCPSRARSSRSTAASIALDEHAGRGARRSPSRCPSRRPAAMSERARHASRRRRRSRVRQSLERTLDARGLSRWCSPPTARPRSSACRAGGIDLILTDLKMPGLTGLELLRAGQGRRARRGRHPAHRLRHRGGSGEGDEGRRLRLPHQAVPARAAPQASCARRWSAATLIAQNRALQQRLDDLLRPGHA